MLDEANRALYARQIMLPEIGEAGQQKLKDARVLIIGAGGLGSPAALYLAAAGVGTLGVCDGDKVSLSNLNRQILHDTRSVGQPKVDSAGARLRGLNPGLRTRSYFMFADEKNIEPLIAGYDFVLDCTDNFDAKYLINDACVQAGKPFCHAGVTNFSGQLMTWLPGVGAPCFRCIFREPPPAFPPQGVMGAVPGVIGCLQAMETVKFVTGAGEPLTGALLVYDALEASFRRVKLPGPNPGCAACGK